MMLNYIEYLNMPTRVAVSTVAFILTMQIVGEVLEFKGKIVPEYMKVRKFFERKRKEKAMLNEVTKTLNDVNKTLSEFNAHYNADNIKMRDDWIKSVNEKLNKHDECVLDISKKLDQNNQDTLELLIESMRSTIIGFASFVSDKSVSVTREQFNRVFKIHHRYETLIKEHGLTNGEVDIAYRIILESYEQHMKAHTFIEDVRGYNYD